MQPTEQPSARRKTGRPVKFELTESTRQAIDDYVRADRQEAWRPSVHRSSRRRVQPDNSAIRAAVIRLARRYRVGSSSVRNAFAPPNKGDPYLSAHGQLASRILRHRSSSSHHWRVRLAGKSSTSGRRSADDRAGASWKQQRAFWGSTIFVASDRTKDARRLAPKHCSGALSDRGRS
jgi:hypothetical protein